MRKLIPLGVLGGLVLTGLFIYGQFNAWHNQGVGYETSLNAQYLSNQNELSAYISGFYEQVGISREKADRLDEILLDAVKGRYEGNAGKGQGSLFFAVKEAYPDLAGLEIFDKIQAYIVAGRQQYKEQQNKLLHMLQQYDNWRGQGLLKQFMVGWMFPSQRLEARIGDTVVHGEDARNQMYRIVLTGDAKKAYQTGVQDPLSIPKRERNTDNAAKSGK